MPESGRALVADDDPSVRMFVELIVCREGFEVVTAADGTEALERLNAGQGFDAVLTDFQMPEADGLAVLRAARRQHPAALMALITRAVLSPAQGADLSALRAFLLEKPVSVSRLIGFLGARAAME